MATKITRWHPDTCSCVVEFEWDDTASPDARTHNPHEIKRQCPAHVSLPDTAAVLGTCFDENRRKNRVHGILLAANDLAVDVSDPAGGQSQRRFRPGVDWAWSFDADRNLAVRLIGSSITSQRRQQLQAEIDAAVGVRKARLE